MTLTTSSMSRGTRTGMVPGGDRPGATARRGLGLRAWPLLAFPALLALASCSSLPQGQTEQPLAEKAQAAADYAKVGDAAFRDRNWANAENYYLLSLDTNWAVDNLGGVVAANNSLGNLYFTIGDLEGAVKAYTEAVRVARMLGPGRYLARSLANLGRLAIDQQKWEEGAAWLDEAVRALGGSDPELEAIIWHNRGMAAYGQGDRGGARQAFSQALQLNTRAKTLRDRASNHYMLAVLDSQDEDYDAATRNLLAALDLDKQAEHSVGILDDLWGLWLVKTKEGKTEEAYGYLVRHFRTAVGSNSRDEALKSLPLLRVEAEKLALTGDLALWNKFSESLGQP